MRLKSLVKFFLNLSDSVIVLIKCIGSILHDYFVLDCVAIIDLREFQIYGLFYVVHTDFSLLVFVGVEDFLYEIVRQLSQELVALGLNKAVRLVVAMLHQ